MHFAEVDFAERVEIGAATALETGLTAFTGQAKFLEFMKMERIGYPACIRLKLGATGWPVA